MEESIAKAGSTSKDRQVSKIFRDGDWNRADRRLVGKTVTKQDFTNPPTHNPLELVFNDKFTEPSYHRSSHFDLGNIKKNPTSLYQNDYIDKPLCLAFNRDRTCEQINNSHFELFPKTSKQLMITSKDFGYKDYGIEHLLASTKERMNDVEELKARIGKDSLQYQRKLSLNQPSTARPIEKILSMSSSNFQAPPLTENKYNLKVPKYNHLDGNYYGADTKISEARAKYQAQKSSSGQVRMECHNRRRDNKSTHFTFGNDNNLDARRSEQTSQFRTIPPLDPTIRAAGKKIPSTKQYSHIFPANNDRTINTRQSLLKSDYKDPKSM